MYIKHWAAPPFDLQRIQTTSEHAVLEFVLVVSLFGHKCKRKKKKKTPAPKKNQQNPSTSEVEALVRCWYAQLQFIPKGKQENESSHLFEPLTILSQQHDKETWLILCWICSSFSRLLLSHFTLPEYTPVCSLAFKLSKEGWSSSLNSGCYNVVSASAKPSQSMDKSKVHQASQVNQIVFSSSSVSGFSEWNWNDPGSYQELPTVNHNGNFICTQPTGILQIRDFLLYHITLGILISHWNAHNLGDIWNFWMNNRKKYSAASTGVIFPLK